MARRYSPRLGIIKKCGRKWCLYTKSKPRRVLGRHPTRKAALRQERAIQASKRRG